MKGLLLKDFYLTRQFARIYLLVIVLYGVLAVAQSNFGFISGMNVCLFAVIPITTLNCDGACGWNSYALSSPISRRTLALEKYLYALLLGGIGLIVTLAVGTAMVLLSSQSIQWAEVFGTMLGQIAATLLMSSFTLPAAFYFGPEKARYVMLAVLLIPSLLILLFFKNDTLSQLSFSWRPLAVISAAALLVLFALSILLTIHICERMEV